MSWLNFFYKVKSSPTPNADESISARITVNYWKLPYKKCRYFGKDYRRWIDVGVILEGISENIEEVIICFPFKIKKEDVDDLSEYLKDDNLSSHILEKKYVSRRLPDTPAYYRLENQDEEKDVYPLYLYEICDHSKETKDLKEGGALILKILTHPKDPSEIKESQDEKTKEPRKYNLYFQFRIKGLSDKDLCHNESISNDLVQSAFSKSEIVDIVFNDLSYIDHSDHQTLTAEYSLLQLSSVDFAFIGSSADETITGNKPFNDCELLEPKIWGEYIREINPDEKKCIAYHLKISAKPYKVFFKTVYSSHQWWKFAKYSIYVIFLSFLASFCFEVCKQTYHSHKQQDPPSAEAKATTSVTDTVMSNDQPFRVVTTTN